MRRLVLIETLDGSAIVDAEACTLAENDGQCWVTTADDTHKVPGTIRETAALLGLTYQDAAPAPNPVDPPADPGTDPDQNPPPVDPEPEQPPETPDQNPDPVPPEDPPAPDPGPSVPPSPGPVPPAPPATATTLDHKGHQMVVKVLGPHRVDYLEPDGNAMRGTRAEVVVHCTPKTQLDISTFVPGATVRGRVDERGRKDWDVMADMTGLMDVSGHPRKTILDLFLHEPSEHDNLAMRDPLRLVMIVHADASTFPPPPDTQGLTDWTIGRVSSYGRGPDSINPAGVVYGATPIPRVPPIFDIAEIRRRMAMPPGASYGKAADKCFRNGDGLGSHERGHLAGHVLKGMFSGDSKVIPGSIRKADMRADAVANALTVLAKGYAWVDPKGRHVAPLLRGSLLDNRTRSWMMGIEGARDHPNPSKRTNDDAYAQNWSIVGRALAGRLLLDANEMSALMGPADEWRWANGLEQYARHVVHLFEIPGLPQRDYPLANGEVADFGMWRGADLVTLLVIAACMPWHPDADAWRDLALSRAPIRQGAIADVSRVSSLYGLFREDWTFADRPGYFSGPGPQMCNWVGLALMVCDWMGWQAPAHLEEFVKRGALGQLTCLPQKPGDIVKNPDGSKKLDGNGDPVLKTVPDAAFTPVMPARCVPRSWDRPTQEKLCAGWHFSILNDWDLA